MLALANSLSLSTTKVSGGAFVMSDYGTLDLWYDFSKLTEADGVVVDGFVNNGAQGSAYDCIKYADDDDNRAIVKDTGMGLKSLLFDNVDDKYMLGSYDSWDTNDATTVVAVFKVTSGYDSDLALAGSSGGWDRFGLSQSNLLLLRFNANRDTEGNNGGITISTNNTTGDTVYYTFTNDAIEVLVMRKDSSDNLHFYNKNGDKIAYLAATASTDQPMKIGMIGAQNNSGNPFGGYMGELGVYSGDIGDANAQALAIGLYNKWQ